MASFLCSRTLIPKATPVLRSTQLIGVARRRFLGSRAAAPPHFSLLRKHPTIRLSPQSNTTTRSYTMASTGNFELLCLENPLLDIQGVG